MISTVPRCCHSNTRKTISLSQLRIGLCQILVIDGDREGNFRRIEHALDKAVLHGAQIAVFPESTILGWQNPQAHALAHPIPGADSDRISALARHHGIMIGIGLDENAGGRLYGSAILVDRRGRLLWKHRKLDVLGHLMSPPYAEGKADDIGAIDTELGRIALLICADTFGADYRARIRLCRPDLMLVPYGWAAKPQDWPQHSLALRNRVIDTARDVGCPVVGVNLVGVMSAGAWQGYTYGGASLAVDAVGNVIVTLTDRDVDLKVISLPS